MRCRLCRPILDTLLTLLPSHLWYTVHVTQHQTSNVLYDLTHVIERLTTSVHDPISSMSLLDRLNIELAVGELMRLRDSIMDRAAAQLGQLR